jgi:hypothetical protein
VSLFERFVNDDMRGIHYAVSMFIATTILWILVEEYRALQRNASDFAGFALLTLDNASVTMRRASIGEPRH